MKIDVKSLVQKVKTFWQNQPPKRKRIALLAGGGILTFALIVTIVLNISSAGTKVLFPGMTQTEAAQVYAELQEMGVKAEINSSGEVRVPQSDWDNIVFQLNQKGYPKTTLSYDTFSSSTGFTSTEFEKKTALIFQAQDRMQQTLMRQDGIADATVTFTVPETSSYVWDQSSEQQSSAGVSVLMKAGYELTPERVSAIKHLAATSVPNLKAENVVVVDASTGVEVSDGSQDSGSGTYSTQRLEFEREIAKSIEDNIKRLLSSRYGADGVTAVATVTLDYDKMVTESKQYQPRSDGESAGVINHYEENYSLDGNVSASGIAGEQNNTDSVPEYQAEDGSSAPTTDYQRSVDYDVGYVLTQIEKGEPILKKASVAVIVNDPNFDTQVEETLVDLISKSVNITADNISVTNLNISANQNNNSSTNWLANLGGLSLRQILIIGIIALLLIVLIIVLVTTLTRRRKRRKEHEQETRFEAEEHERQQTLQREIEEHKRQLQSEAMASADEKENAITQEVRDFVKDNPEITAALIRSMLREEK